MRKLSLYLFTTILFSVILTSCVGGSATTKDGKEIAGQEYFLKVNIRYEHPKKIYSTNYHKGARLKVGDKFKVTDVSGKKITFTDKKGIEYVIIHHRKHNPIDLTELFERYFSKTSVTASGGAFTKFTKKEQKNIRSGQIVKGMSKNAVLMSYGYPPSHRTPSLDGDDWVYWEHRWGSKIATFEKGKLVSYQ